MGMSNYTTSGPNDDSSNPSGPGGPGGFGPAVPPMGGSAGKLDNVAEMLINLNERHKQDTPIMFRDALIRQSVSVLVSKQKPNPLLLGPAGTGKTKIVEDIARRLECDDALIPPRLKGYTIYELPLSNLVAGAGIVGELESRLAKIVDFAADKDSKAILFIDEIHLIQDTKDPTYKKVAQILKPALARGDMHLIGATTTNEARSFDNDPAFQRRFERLIVDELTRDQTEEVLIEARPGFLQHYKNEVRLSDDAMRAAALIADQHAKVSQHRPDSALTLVDRTCADAIVAHKSAIAEAENRGDTNVAQALRSVAVIDINEKKLQAVALKLLTGQAEKQTFDETRLLDALVKIKGQDEIVKDLLNMLRRDNLAVFPRTKPMAWMFAGPSGVGKTEVCKLISQELTSQPPIILNMGEYATEMSETKILGSAPGYVGSDSDREKPFDTLESNPHRVILLDEMEKAHHSIQSLMLSALDEGYLKMSDGKVIDLSKAILVATTNAARDELTKQRTGFQSAALPTRRTQQELTRALQEAFKPEFLGRFTKLIAFNKLTQETYREILVAAYSRERERIVSEHPRKGKSIPVAIDDDVLAREVSETYLADQGARPAEQTARRLIEDALLNPAPQTSVGGSAVLAQSTPGPGNDAISS